SAVATSPHTPDQPAGGWPAGRERVASTAAAPSTAPVPSSAPATATGFGSDGDRPAPSGDSSASCSVASPSSGANTALVKTRSVAGHAAAHTRKRATRL